MFLLGGLPTRNYLPDFCQQSCRLTLTKAKGPVQHLARYRASPAPDQSTPISRHESWEKAPLVVSKNAAVVTGVVILL
ncbi:hypothetical protein P8C59_007216 [Phyllachora maydis]|uniref:Uncharacterized protein n=1 Tax=Phyllachora maydis TaxID=1825666 RepID=A0AAD9I7W6_9PEZI|nr:hypothetical protein P8C59_007216 [Phyllachora maydis]